MKFKEFYNYTPILVNLGEFYNSLDEETIASLRSDTDFGRKSRSKPVGSFFENVSLNWTVEYKSTSVTTDGVSFWEQKVQPVDLPGIRASLKEVREAFNGDVLAHCSCPDFKYRMAYYATMDDWKYGSAETRPANITNPPPPHSGPLCKHLVNAFSVIKGSTPKLLSTYRKNFL